VTSAERAATVPSVDGGPIEIRRIRSDEGMVLRDLRLRSLIDAPVAFGQRLDEARALPDAHWIRTARAGSRGRGHAWYVAMTDRTTVGLVHGRHRPPSSLLLFSMWVDPLVRGRGIAHGLIDALEAWAVTWHATETVLWVYPSNEAAIGLYRSMGFRILRADEDAAVGSRFGALAMRREIAREDGSVSETTMSF